MHKDFKVLLVVMPFHNIWAPNLGTSILKSVLNKNGFICDIYYANIEFAKRSGIDFAEVIHESDILSNDKLFAHLMPGYKSGPDIKINPGYKAKENSLFSKAKSVTDEFINDIAFDIANKDYDLIGFSLIFQSVPSLVLANRIKEFTEKPKVILGGSNCEGVMGLTLHRNFQWVDFICQGEGEQLIVELAEHLSDNRKPITEIQGLVYRENGHSLCNGTRTLPIANLDELPEPDYKDWKIQLESNGFSIKSDKCILPFESSRGCWYGDKKQCVFCGLSGEKLNYRIKSPHKAFEEIKNQIRKYEVSNFFATDLIIPNQYFESFLPMLKESNLDIKIIYEIKASLLKNQLYKLKEANITNVQPGLETLSTPMLDLMRKGVKAYQNIRILKWSFEYGISSIWNILYGLPGEDPEEYSKMKKLIPYISHLQPPLFGIFPIVLQRFSPLYKEMDEWAIDNVKPLKEYTDIYQIPEEEAKKLAYYFNFPEKNQNKFTYIRPLKRAISKWYNSIGEVVFLSIEHDNKLYLYDTRMVAVVENAVLSGLEKKIFLNCDAGTKLSSISEKLNKTEREIKAVLDKFIAHKWVIYIDDRYLSLSVSMDEYTQENTDIDINLSLSAAAYRILMKKKCKTLKRIGERNLQSVIEESVL